MFIYHVTYKGLEIVGLAILVTGIVLRYMIGRNRFYRRNIAGVEIFSSY